MVKESDLQKEVFKIYLKDKINKTIKKKDILRNIENYEHRKLDTYKEKLENIEEINYGKIIEDFYNLDFLNKSKEEIREYTKNILLKKIPEINIRYSEFINEVSLSFFGDAGSSTDIQIDDFLEDIKKIKNLDLLSLSSKNNINYQIEDLDIYKQYLLEESQKEEKKKEEKKERKELEEQIKLMSESQKYQIENIKLQRAKVLSKEDIKKIVTIKDINLVDKMSELLEYIENQINQDGEISEITGKKANHIRNVIVKLNSIIQTHKGTPYAEIFDKAQNKEIIFERVYDELIKDVGDVDDKIEKIYRSVLNPSLHNNINVYNISKEKLNTSFDFQIKPKKLSINDSLNSLFANNLHKENFKYDDFGRKNTLFNEYKEEVEREYSEEQNLRKLYKLFAKKNQNIENNKDIEVIQNIEKIIQNRNEKIIEEIEDVPKSNLNNLLYVLKELEEDKHKVSEENSEIVNKIKEEYINDLFNFDLLHGLFTNFLFHEFKKDMLKPVSIEEKHIEAFKTNILRDTNINPNIKEMIEKKIDMVANIVKSKPNIEMQDLIDNTNQKKNQTLERLRDKNNRILSFQGRQEKIKPINDESLVNLLIEELNRKNKEENPNFEYLTEGEPTYIDKVIDFLKDIEEDNEKLNIFIKEIAYDTKIDFLGKDQDLKNIDKKTIKIIFKSIIEKVKDQNEKQNVLELINKTNSKITKKDKEKEELERNQEELNNFKETFKKDKKEIVKLETLINKLLKDYEGEEEVEEISQKIFTSIKNDESEGKIKDEIRELFDFVKNDSNVKNKGRNKGKQIINKGLRTLKEPQHVLNFTLTQAHKVNLYEEYNEIKESLEKELDPLKRLEKENQRELIIKEASNYLEEEHKVVPYGYYKIIMDEINSNTSVLNDTEIKSLKRKILKTTLVETIMGDKLSKSDYKKFLELEKKNDENISEEEMRVLSDFYNELLRDNIQKEYFDLSSLFEKWENLNINEEINNIYTKKNVLNIDIPLQKTKNTDFISRTETHYLNKLSKDLLALNQNKENNKRTLEDIMKIGVKGISENYKENDIDISIDNLEYIEGSMNILEDATYSYKSSDILSSLFTEKKEIEEFQNIKDDKEKINNLAERLFALTTIDGKLFKDLEGDKRTNKEQILKLIMGPKLSKKDDEILRRYQVFFKRYLYTLMEVYKTVENEVEEKKKFGVFSQDESNSDKIFETIKSEAVLNINDQNFNKKLSYIDKIDISKPKEDSLLNILKNIETNKLSYPQNEKDIEGSYNTYTRILIILKDLKLEADGREFNKEKGLVLLKGTDPKYDFIRNLIPKSMYGTLLNLYNEKGEISYENLEKFFTGTHSEQLKQELTKNVGKHNFFIKTYNISKDNTQEVKELKKRFKESIKERKKINQSKKDLQSPLQSSLMGKYLDNFQGDELTTTKMKEVYENILDEAYKITPYKVELNNFRQEWEKRLKKLGEKGTIRVNDYHKEFKKLINGQKIGETLRENIKDSFANEIDFNKEQGKDSVDRLLDLDSIENEEVVMAEINQKIRMRELKNQEKKASIEELGYKVPELQHDMELYDMSSKQKRMNDMIKGHKSWKSLKKAQESLDKPIGYFTSRYDKVMNYMDENYTTGKIIKKGFGSVMKGAFEGVNTVWSEIAPTQLQGPVIPTDTIMNKYNATTQFLGNEYKDARTAFYRSIGIPEDKIKLMNMNREERREYQKKKEKEQMGLEFLSLLSKKDVFKDNNDLFKLVIDSKGKGYFADILSELQSKDSDLLSYKPENITESKWKKKVKEAKLNMNKRTNEVLIDTNIPIEKKRENLEKLFKKLVSKDETKMNQFFDKLLRHDNPLEYFRKNEEGLNIDKDPGFKTFISMITGGDNRTDNIDEKKINELRTILVKKPNKLKINIFEMINNVAENKTYKTDMALKFYLESMKNNNQEVEGLNPQRFFELNDLDREGELKRFVNDKNYIEDIIKYNNIIKKYGGTSITVEQKKELEKHVTNIPKSVVNEEGEELSKRREHVKYLLEERKNEDIDISNIQYDLLHKVKKNLEELIKRENLNIKDNHAHKTRYFEEKIEQLSLDVIEPKQKIKELRKINADISLEIKNTSIEADIENQKENNKDTRVELSLKEVMERLSVIDNLEEQLATVLKEKEKVIGIDLEKVRKNMTTSYEYSLIRDIMIELKTDIVKEQVENDKEKIQELFTKKLEENKDLIQREVEKRAEKKKTKTKTNY